MPLRPGDTVGNYTVVARIGGGGTASVFEVTHVSLGTRHALKVLSPQWVEDASLRARFLQEGKLQASFDHPGLVRVTDTVAEPGVAGLVMELLEGETIRARLDREGHIAPQEAVHWVAAVADALEEAHSKEVVHRDIKPENLFLQKTPSGESVRILDFGIAKGPHGNRTTQRGALGTCAYMAPEQVRDPAAVTAKSDVFALGAVLWELLTGKPAFEGKTPFDSMERVIHLDPGAPSQVRSNIPGWLDEVVGRALAKDPEKRFVSARAFEKALASKGRELLPPPTQTTLPESPPARWGWWLVGGMVGLLGLGALGLGAVVLGFVFLKPPKVETFTATSDDCGVLSVQANVSGRRGTAEMLVNGSVVRTEPLQGTPLDLNHTMPLPKGSMATIEVRAGKDVHVATHRVSGEPVGVAFEAKQGQREGSVARTLVKLTGTCVPPGLRYEASVNGQVSKGSATADFFLDTRGLPEGRHAMEVTLVDGEKTAAHEVFVLAVGEKPPPNDLDMDGHQRMPMGRDCDDTNAGVNPDVEERDVPNGLDDNCDGRVDEGTIAYDDDGDGVSEQQGDCDDTNASVRPGAPEIGDCKDQDCDGEVDEGVRRPQREDLYENNGSRATAYDLNTKGKRRFRSSLALVASSSSDEAWFKFYSQDGDFDDWGIDVTVPRLPDESTFLVEVFNAAGTSRGSELISTETQMVRVRGKAFRDDSGEYWLRVSPQSLFADWCPLEVEVVAR